MKAVILAGGLGTRLSEETVSKPKPMVEIGGKPILWHIMKIYSHYGINEFIICCGYKGDMIKQFFVNYINHQSDITIDMVDNKMTIHENRVEPWKITLVDTGATTLTGGRLKRIEKYLTPNEDFCFTYGDGVADINILELIQFHKSHGKEATLTATHPPGRYGALEIEGDMVKLFHEKPEGDGKLINAGFFVLNISVISRIQDDNTIWEQEPLKSLALDDQLVAYKHAGFWQPMDKLSDKKYLEELWINNNALWKVW